MLLGRRWVVGLLAAVLGVLVWGFGVLAQQGGGAQLDEIARQLQAFADKKDYEGAKKYIARLVRSGQLQGVANSEKFNPSHFFFHKFLDGKNSVPGVL